MKRRRVVLRHAARHDVDEAIRSYLLEGAIDAASGFVDRLERTLEQIARHPESGSPRYAQELSIPGLRSQPLEPYPPLVFYMPGEDTVDVWRVLHGERDIPAWMREP